MSGPAPHSVDQPLPAETAGSASDDLWSAYLAAHQTTANRVLHVAGTLLSWLLLGVALHFRAWSLLLAVPVVGYGLAWLGHYLERNCPLTFTHPLRALICDYRMVWLLLTGQLKAGNSGMIRRPDEREDSV